MTGCAREVEVLAAARHDRWDDDLRGHLLECDPCVATASVAPWMRRFARIGVREHALPDPSIVWLKARLLKRSADASRATRPLDAVQMLAYLVVAGGWAALLTSRWDVFSVWLHGITPAAVLENATAVGSISMSFFATLFVLLSTTVMLAMHTILADE